MKKPISKLWGILGVAGLYLLAGLFGVWLGSGTLRGATPIWPATGLALGLMLLLGRWIWPGILLGAFLTSILAHRGALSFPTIAGPLGAAMGNTLEVLAGWWLVERFAAGRDTMQKPQTIFLFVALAGVLSTAISATTGVVSLSVAGFEPWGRFGFNWLAWWSGHMVSAITITPVLLVWNGSVFPRWNSRKWLEAMALVLALVLVSLAVFGKWTIDSEPGFPLKFLAAPVLLWAAFRFGLRGSTGAVLLLAGMATYESLAGSRPSAETTWDILLLQSFVAVMAVMSLVVAADVSQRQQAEAGRNAWESRYQDLRRADLEERKRSEAALKSSNESLDRLNHQLEQRVRERTAQLESVNKELEAFAFSVSHDLRAPLRSIRGFSEVVLERFANQIDPRGKDYLRRACESSHQMDRLIEDLLRFSRVTRAELHWRPVNLTPLAMHIAAELQRAEPQRSVEFIIAPNLHAGGDEHLLRIVLDNLLRNSWKFTSKRPNSRIEFGSLPAHEFSSSGDGAPAFFVRDDGAGFPMQHAEKLFGVFQRLHSSSDFPGTGVGLATVQRIINRHGGRVWATSAVDQGATFYFTLPDAAVGQASSLSSVEQASSLSPVGQTSNPSPNGTPSQLSPT